MIFLNRWIFVISSCGRKWGRKKISKTFSIRKTLEALHRFFLFWSFSQTSFFVLIEICQRTFFLHNYWNIINFSLNEQAPAKKTKVFKMLMEFWYFGFGRGKVFRWENSLWSRVAGNSLACTSKPPLEELLTYVSCFLNCRFTFNSISRVFRIRLDTCKLHHRLENGYVT